MTRKRWSELSGPQQAAIIAAIVVQEALAAATLWDLRRRPSAQIRGSKKLWVAAVTVLVTGGPGSVGTPPVAELATRAPGRRHSPGWSGLFLLRPPQLSRVRRSCRRRLTPPSRPG